MSAGPSRSPDLAELRRRSRQQRDALYANRRDRSAELIAMLMGGTLAAIVLALLVRVVERWPSGAQMLDSAWHGGIALIVVAAVVVIARRV